MDQGNLGDGFQQRLGANTRFSRSNQSHQRKIQPRKIFFECVDPVLKFNLIRKLRFLTPKRPPIFYGRTHMVSEIIETVLSDRHVMLIGTGGMGKSSIAKAVLNEELIAASFEARLFITYDGVASSAMTYQLFLDRIAAELKLLSPDLTSIIERLESITALLVIDNAEILLEAGDVDNGRIAEVLDTLGSLTNTRVIVTTRNHASISANFLCKRITVLGISMDAACDAFSAVYKIAAINDTIKAIFTALDYHPLSINILANAAMMNEWGPEEIDEAWSEQKTGVLENANDKYRSLRAATEISIVSFKNKTLVLQILRAIAFLPQGIHRGDFASIFPSIPNVAREVEAVQRSSLIYRDVDRLTMLAPIRMYISDKYNPDLPYDDQVLSYTRAYYHNNLFYEAQDFVEREHGNIDSLMHFDMTSSLYQSDIKIHSIVLDKAQDFLICTTVQPTSLWQLLIAEIYVDSFGRVESLVQLISVCLTWICAIDYNRNNHNDALEKLEVAELYCRNHIPVCNERLVICLRLKSYIFQSRGNLFLARKALEEGSSIAQALGDLLDEALLNDSLADVLLLQGKVIEAASLYLSAQQYFEANHEYHHLVNLLVSRSHDSISQNNFTNARLVLNKAMKLDQLHNGGRKWFRIMCWKASCEGWAGDVAAALEILQEATQAKVSSGTSQFGYYLDAIRGGAYYEARMGRFDDAPNSIARLIELRRENGGDLTGGDLTDYFVSALITNFAGERGKVISMIQKILNRRSGNDRQITAIYHRTLAEILLIEGRDNDGRAQFAQAKAICDDTGISPKHLYVNVQHWFSLPVKYDGWERFLADTL